MWKEGIREFFRIAGDSGLAMQNFRVDEYIAQGDRVVVLGSEEIPDSKEGEMKKVLWAHSWSFSAGKIVKLVEYADTAALAEALRHPGT